MRSLMIAAAAALTFANATTALAGDESGCGRGGSPQAAKPATGSHSLGMPIPLHPTGGGKCLTTSRANGNAPRHQLAGDPGH
jgi:hypothetical protein